MRAATKRADCGSLPLSAKIVPKIIQYNTLLDVLDNLEAKKKEGERAFLPLQSIDEILFFVCPFPNAFLISITDLELKIQLLFVKWKQTESRAKLLKLLINFRCPIGIAQSSQQVLKSIKDMQVFLLWQSVAGMMMLSPRVRALFQSYLFVLLWSKLVDTNNESKI